MKKLYALTVAILGATLIHAQNPYVHQVIFLNEGWYDFWNDTLMVPPSVGTYDPLSKTYTEFAVITDADFATDVIVDDAIYVAADNSVIKYDKNSLQEMDRINVNGVRKLAIWNNQLLVTRGDYLVTFNSYFQVYDKATLSLIYELDALSGPKYASEGIAIISDTAYLAVNNGFDFGNETALIGIVDLNSQTYAGEVDMGFDARNPDGVMQDDNYVYTLNNKDFSSSSISRYDPATRTVVVVNNVAANSGCGTSVLANDHIYFMEYAVSALARFDVSALAIVDTLMNTSAYYGLADDKINQQLYATVTDYVSSGRAYLLEYNGTIKDSFDVGVSAGNIAFDVRTTTGMDEHLLPHLMVSPNPTSGMIFISSDEHLGHVRVMNSVGEVISMNHLAQHNIMIDLALYPSGIYLIAVGTSERVAYKVLKQ